MKEMPENTGLEQKTPDEKKVKMDEKPCKVVFVTKKKKTVESPPRYTASEETLTFIFDTVA